MPREVGCAPAVGASSKGDLGAQGLTSSIKASAKRNRILAVAIAIGGHLAMVMVFVLERPRLAAAPATVIEVQLVPMTRRSQPIEPSRRVIPQKLAATKPRSSQSAPAVPSPADVHQSPQAPQAVQTTVAAAEADARLASALRGTVGCAAAGLVHLSASEREACEQRARRLGAGFATANLGVDPSKRLAFEDAARKDWLSQPFLAQKPHNGCVPRVSSASDLPGKAPQQTFVGVACAISF